VTQEAFLGVEHSARGQRWIARAFDERLQLVLMQKFDLPEALARALAARGVGLDEAEDFLSPRLRQALPDPSLLRDMDRATQRFVQALESGEKIAVYGDYDVDGATSSALLLRFARALGVTLRLYIPDRIKEGYGPHEAAMKTLTKEGVKLVVCVDCGTTSYQPLQAAREMGLDVIVIDHHAAAPLLPEVVAMVNPNRLDESEEARRLSSLAAVGVTYLFVVSVNRALRQKGFYTAQKPEPDLMQFLDLVALGTVCDVVSLTGLNRVFVAQGLKVMQARSNQGLAALSQVVGAKPVMDAFTAGFILGPRINAGGRIGQADWGARLLVSEDEQEVMELAEKLHALNDMRRAMEAQALAEVENLIVDEQSPLIFLARAHWHPGVIGIVASRLKDKFHRPAIVIALEGEVGKGSGRSIGAVDLGAAVMAARQQGLLINGGGHKMAAGLTVEKDKLEALNAFLQERVGKVLEAEPFVPALNMDGLVASSALTSAFVERLEALAPFGAGNPEPRFALADCKILRAAVVKEKHVSLTVSQGGARLSGIAFRAMENNLGAFLLGQVGKSCHLAGTLRREVWQGRERVQLFVEDAAV